MSSKHSKPTLFTALFFASMVSASVSCAAPGGDRGRPQGPSPEATKACADLAKDDACSFTGRRNNTVSGTCIVVSGGGEALACAPAGGPPGMRSRPE